MHVANIVLPIVLLAVIGAIWLALRDTDPPRPPGRHRPDTAGKPDPPASTPARPA